MFKTIWIITGLLIFLTAFAGAGELSSFLPESGEIAGWTTYQWPRDAGGLYWLINGAGQVFIDRGFQEAVFQDYHDPGLLDLKLEIYDQGSAANAESTYHDPILEMGWEVPRDDFGAEGRIDTTGWVSYKAEFWREQYFVRITAFQKSPYGLESLEAFCYLVDEKLGGKPADGLPANGEVPGWTRYLGAMDSVSIVSFLDSEADLFLEWGCSAGLKQDYYDSQFVLLQLELFDQGTPVNAQSLYHDPGLETGGEVPRDDFGQEGRLDTTSSWTYSAQFWRDRYLARLLVQDKSEASLANLVTFCQLVDQKIQGTPVESEILAPAAETPAWELTPAFPNPFNDHVLIQYRIPQKSPARQPFQLNIYNVSGQMVRRLAQGSGAVPGLVAVRWDGRDDLGKPVASGVYFCRLSCGHRAKTAKVVLCR